MDHIDMVAQLHMLSTDDAGAVHQEDLLDEALNESFPASDPVSSYRFD